MQTLKIIPTEDPNSGHNNNINIHKNISIFAFIIEIDKDFDDGDDAMMRLHRLLV